MSYRRDSDIFFNYGVVRPRKERLSHTISQSVIQNKTKLMVWFVSHCSTPGNRENYYRNLQKHIPGDIIGRCGKQTCARKNSSCEGHLLNNTYKFYFSAENSNCRDYITEKAFNYTFFSIIPVVKGRGNYSLYFPRNSLINVRDYSHPEILAKRLTSIGKNMTMYKSYFDWKAKYYIRAINYFSDGDRDNHYCKLCHRLHNQRKFRRVYKNISAWWFGDEKTSGHFCSNSPQ